ncbi:response regulator [Cohnella sp. JJ-181]|uniref:response regulator n=1 Tax=Cohnella rhizoplanae TaxID=2974897 RepID=UPI0022FF7025|nr:response regulator [Cohnella sp. JJ-181]CAI6075674.1 HTH-type transcriptional activator RhaR [Cohnella sp. JJ-181]
MKAIIIDDEKHVRGVLRLLADWERFGIGEVLEARDGEEAKKLIEAHGPEIIFTDMNMPNLDGIGLLEWLREHAEGSKTIVISAYDDFHYMRNAIFYGSFDYILKPMEADVLNETLGRAVEAWHREAVSRRSAFENDRIANAAKPLYWDRVLSGLLGRSPAPEAAERLAREFGAVPGRDLFTVFLISVRAYATMKAEGDTERAFAALLPVCGEVLQRGEGVAFRHTAKPDELAVLAWNLKDADALAKRLHAGIWQATRMKLLVAIGKEARQTADAYESALEALMRCDLQSAFKARAVVRHDVVESRPVLHLVDYAQDLTLALQSGSAEGADRLLDRMLETVRASGGMTFEQLHNWESQYRLLQARWLQEYDIRDTRALGGGDGYWDEDGSFSMRRFRDEKRRQFHELIRLLHDVKYKKEKNSIREIESYLRQNYKREVTLQEIAERFYLSREYISRKFRQEFGLTITDYVTQVRIEKAKELLENPHLKVYEIADFVGYQNDKYFIKVFKRAEGVTPSEYVRARAEIRRGGRPG